MSQSGISLIAGLGNHGDRYASTRHNAGRWLIERLQDTYPLSFSLESRFKAELARLDFEGRTIRVVVPNSFMNLSGQTIAPLAAYFRINPAEILVVHDELDHPPGSARLKVGGGHGGHNGLRDIISRLGSDAFARLRIGIGHPGPGNDVSGYVLKKPLPAERVLIEDAIDRAINVLPEVLKGNFSVAMNKLHTESEQVRKHGN